MLTEVLAEEVEPILDACHVSLIRRKFESSLAQELFYQRADFVDQQFIAVAGDDKVIGISTRCTLGLTRRPLLSLRRKRCASTTSNPSNVRLASVGEITPLT